MKTTMTMWVNGGVFNRECTRRGRNFWTGLRGLTGLGEGARAIVPWIVFGVVQRARSARSTSEMDAKGTGFWDGIKRMNRIEVDAREMSLRHIVRNAGWGHPAYIRGES